MGEENSRHALKQSDSKLKTIATWSLAFWVYPDRFWLLTLVSKVPHAGRVSVISLLMACMSRTIEYSVGKNVPVGFKSFYFRHSRQKTWLFVSWFKWLEGYWTLCMVKHRQTTRWARRETGQSSRTVPKKVLKKWNDHRIFAWKTGIQWN